jgi:glycosyltransferase involved in cell wall biosynthesis
MNILVLAALTDATGNAVTARRIAAQLSPTHAVTIADAITSTPDSLRAQVREHRIQLAIGLHALLAGPLLTRLDIPYVLIFGGTDLYEQTHALHQAQMAKAVAGASRLIAFSAENRARAQWLWPEARGRVDCLPQAVDLSVPAEKFSLRARLGLAAHDILVLLPTGIRRVKDPLHVVEAFSVWNAVEPRAHLAIVGAVLEPDYAVTAMRVLAERSGVHAVPALLRPQMLAAIAEADLVLNSSLSEGMCGTLLEAMRLGIPVVARRNAGNESLVIHGHTGLLYDTPAEMVHWGRALVASGALRDRLTRTARSRVEELHSPERERAAYLRIIAETAPAIGSRELAPLPPVDELSAVAATGKRLGLNDAVLEGLHAMIVRLQTNSELAALTAQLAGVLATAPPSVAIAAVHERATEQTLGNQAPAFYLALALMQVPAARERSLARGVSESIVHATHGDLVSWAHHFHRQQGLLGITLEILEWAQRYLRGELVQLGALQFDLRPFSFPTRVYRHRATRGLSATTVDGRALELTTGTIASQRSPVHDPAQWEIALEPGSPILEMWFPGAISKITLEQVARSMREAYSHFAKLSPETVPLGVCGESWRLDPQVVDLVPHDCGIHELQRACALFPSALSEAKTIRRLFGPSVDRGQLAAMPRAQMNPVQVAIAEFLQSPEASLRARGGFVLREEAERISQW